MRVKAPENPVLRWLPIVLTVSTPEKGKYLFQPWVYAPRIQSED